MGSSKSATLLVIALMWCAPVNGQAPFVRGDANTDHNLDVSDPVRILIYLFGTGAVLTCRDAADANDDGTVDISDATFMIDYLFIDGEPPPSPYPGLGMDETPDDLPCIIYPSVLMDTDEDGVPDVRETANGTDPYRGDTDRDGLDDGAEEAAGTNPTNPDTDGDLLPDGWEVNAGLDPLVNDALGDLDSDGFTNIQEFNRGVDPANPDSDGDGLYDGWEVLVAGLNPTATDSDGNGRDDGLENPDDDGLTNVQEFLGADGDPSTADGTLPDNPDTDGDTMADGWERDNGFDPTDAADGEEDLDADGLKNREDYRLEVAFGVPGAYANDDVDGDGIPDGREPYWSSDIDGDGDVNALDADSDGDGIQDGSEDADHDGRIAGDTNANRALDVGESWTETDPANADSDGDGLDDLEELQPGFDGFVTDPARRDTDDDGLGDSESWRVVFRTDAVDTDGDGVNDYVAVENDVSWVAVPVGRGMNGFGRVDGQTVSDSLMTAEGTKIRSIDPTTGSQRDVETPEGYKTYFIPESHRFSAVNHDQAVTAETYDVAWHPTLDMALVACANTITGGATGYIGKYVPSLNRVIGFVSNGEMGTSADMNAIAWDPAGTYCLVVGNAGNVVRVTSTRRYVRFDQGTSPSTGTAQNFTGVSFASDGSYAVLVTDTGEAIKYVDNPRSFSTATTDVAGKSFAAVAARPGVHSALIIGSDPSSGDAVLARYNGEANHVSNAGNLLPNAGALLGVTDLSWRPDGERAIIVGRQVGGTNRAIVLKYKPETVTPPFAEAVYLQDLEAGIGNPPADLWPRAIDWRPDGLYAAILAESPSGAISLVIQYRDTSLESGVVTELRRDTGAGAHEYRSIHWWPAFYGQYEALLGETGYGSLTRLQASTERVVIDTPFNDNPLYGRPPSFAQATEARRAVVLQFPQRAFDAQQETRWDSGLSPLDPDQDNDGLKDGEEVAFLGYADPDGDNLVPPLDSDSDDDGINDGDDLYALIDGTTWSPVWFQDSDGDGLPNALDDDSDNDGLTDGVEDVNRNGRFDGGGESNPLSGDQDQDGLLDGEESSFGLSISIADADGDGQADGLDSDLDGLIDGLEPDWNSDADGDGLVNALDQDSDGDGLPDGWIDGWVYDPAAGTWGTPDDAQRNGVPDACEYEDKDLDGVVDPGETDPRNADTDADLLTDGDECRLGTGLLNPDSDGDTILDGEELMGWTITVRRELPSSPAEVPTFVSEDLVVQSDPLTADTDADFLSDADERAQGTNPRLGDTDGDGWSDINERIPSCGLDPNDADTDGDLLSDGKEVTYRSVIVYSELTGLEIEARSSDTVSSNPCIADSDGDGHDDYREYVDATHPRRRDTDGDGLQDDEDPMPLGVEGTSPCACHQGDVHSWATDWQIARARYHLEVTATDTAGLSRIQIEGTTWNYYDSPAEATEEYTQWVYPTSSYDLDIVLTDINGNESTLSVHVPSAFEAVDDLLFDGRIGEVFDQIEDWALQLLDVVSDVLSDLLVRVAHEIKSIVKDPLGVLKSALCKVEGVIRDHVEIDCEDYGIRITSPETIHDLLERLISVTEAGLGTLEHALSLAGTFIEQNIMSFEDLEDIVFDAMTTVAPTDVEEVVSLARARVTPLLNDLKAGDLDAIAEFLSLTGTDVVDFVLNRFGSYDVVGPESLILEVPADEDPIPYFAGRMEAILSHFVSTGEVEIPCLSTLIHDENFPIGFETDRVVSDGILVPLTISFSVDVLEPAVQAGIYLLTGLLEDGREFADVYLFVFVGASTIYWPFAQEAEIAPVDFNIGISTDYSARNRSGLGAGLTLFGLGLNLEVQPLALEVTSIDLSLSHFSGGVGYSFPVLLITEN